MVLLLIDGLTREGVEVETAQRMYDQSASSDY